MSDNLDTENNLKAILQLRCLDPMEIFSKEEAARYLKMSKSYLSILIRNNQVPYVKVARRVLFRKQDLFDWMQKMLIEAETLPEEKDSEEFYED